MRTPRSCCNQLHTHQDPWFCFQRCDPCGLLLRCNSYPCATQIQLATGLGMAVTVVTATATVVLVAVVLGCHQLLQ